MEEEERGERGGRREEVREGREEREREYVDEAPSFGSRGGTAPD